MRASDCRMLALVLAAALWLPLRASADEPWMLSVDGSVALPLGSPQSEWFGAGGALSVSLWRSVASPLAIGLRTRTGLLADGPSPRDPTLADPTIGTFFGLSLGTRLRLEPLWDPSPRRSTGPWVEAFGGAALTGLLVRPAMEAGVGWGIEIGDVDLAPVIRWSAVFETESQLAPGHAHLLLFGLEITFFDPRSLPIEPPAPVIPGTRAQSRCPGQDEDVDGFEDEDGCPDTDNDADGVLDALDACPNVPEDLDGLIDQDGCPERDADADAILDDVDACPSEREIVNGVDDTDGCPDEGLIELVDDRIALDERVLFDLNRARVRHRAYPILEAIVALYQQHPEWTELRIEGHADPQGGRTFNQRLSEHRARAVRNQLVSRGIPAPIITSVGYGETRPRAHGHDEESYRVNRRVEFVVVRRTDAPSAGQGEER